MGEINSWRAEVADGRNPRDIKVLLAQEIVNALPYPARRRKCSGRI